MMSKYVHTLLVVEDDFLQRRQMVRILEMQGYGIIEASDGMEAICLLDGTKVDLVLTDLRMPFGGGISLLKYVKIFFPHIPVLIVTAYPEDIEDIGPDALLCKPYGLDELLRCIQHLTSIIW